MIKIKRIVFIIIGIFLLSMVSVSVYTVNAADEIEDDFLDEEFDEDEFDEDDDFPGIDDEEDMMPPAKKTVKKTVVEKEEPKKEAKKEVKKAVKKAVVGKEEVKKKVKKAEKKAKKKEVKKDKVVKKKSVPEIEEDIDLFDFDEDAEAVEEEVEPAALKQEIPEGETTFKVYKAKRGDTLYTIADKFYSDPDRWEEIWKYNKYIKDPTVLYRGDSVIVPVRKIVAEEEVKSEELKEVQEKFKKKYEKRNFFAGEVDYDGSIIALKNKKLLCPVAGNTVFVDIGTEDGVKPNSMYTVYREKGELAKKVGVVRITGDIGENDASALILKSIESIYVGDFILKK